jgi:hypothetical protein
MPGTPREGGFEMAHNGPHCAHCNVEIQDRSSMVERNGKQFCCNNCAMAMSSGG